MQRGVVDSSPEGGSRRRAPVMLVPLHKNPRDNITKMHKLNMKVREQSRGLGVDYLRRNREETAADVASPAGDWGGLGARWAWSRWGNGWRERGGLIGRLGRSFQALYAGIEEGRSFLAMNAGVKAQ